MLMVSSYSSLNYARDPSSDAIVSSKWFILLPSNGYYIAIV